jgi:hypothetical protein
VKQQGIQMDKELAPTELHQFIAGFAGAVVGTNWSSIKTVVQGAITIFAGATSALYLTPLVARQLGWQSHEQWLGLSFLLGTLGLRTVQAMNMFIERKLVKMEAQ